MKDRGRWGEREREIGKIRKAEVCRGRQKRESMVTAGGKRDRSGKERYIVEREVEREII